MQGIIKLNQIPGNMQGLPVSYILFRVYVEEKNI